MPTIRERIIRALQPPPAAQPKTYPGKVLGSKVQYLGKRDPKQAEYRSIYTQGGLVCEGVDCYPLLMFSNGYRIEGPRRRTAEQFLDDLDFENDRVEAHRGFVGREGGARGDACPGSTATKYPIAKLDHRYPETFEEVRDDYGNLARVQADDRASTSGSGAPSM